MRVAFHGLLALAALLCPLVLYGQSADSSLALRRIAQQKQVAYKTRAVHVTLPDSSLAILKEYPSAQASLDARRNWVAWRLQREGGYKEELDEGEFWAAVDQSDIADVASERLHALESQKSNAVLMYLVGAVATYAGANMLSGSSEIERGAGVGLLVPGFGLSLTAPFVFYDAVLKKRTRLAPYGVAREAAEEHNRALMLELEKSF